MRDYFLKTIKIFLVANFLTLLLGLPVLALAQSEIPKTPDERCDFLQGLLKITRDNPELPPQDLGNLAEGLPRFCTAEELLFALINNILRGAAIFAVIMIMWGGYSYLFSAGNEETAEKGKKTLMYAVLGLVIVIMAFTIVRILATTLTSNPAGSAGGGGSSATSGSSSGASGSGSAGNVQGVVTAPIPTLVSAQGPFTVLATVRADKEDKLKQLCGGDTSNCAVSVEVNGQQKAQAVFSRNATQFVASVSVQGPFTPGSSLNVTVKVNGAEISSGSVTVSGGGNSEI